MYFLKKSKLSLLVLLKYRFTGRTVASAIAFPFRIGQVLCFGACDTRDANKRNNANLLLI